MSHFRIKSVRPVYRRAGLDLSAGVWLETDLSDLGPAALGRLFGDPIVVIQRAIEGEWETIPARVRKEAADLYRGMADGATDDNRPGEELAVAAVAATPATPSADGRRPVDESPTLTPELRKPLAAEPAKLAAPRPKAVPGARKPGGMRGR